MIFRVLYRAVLPPSAAVGAHASTERYLSYFLCLGTFSICLSSAQKHGQGTDKTFDLFPNFALATSAGLERIKLLVIS